jgi:4'-phosphopantetheinyl transferase
MQSQVERNMISKREIQVWRVETTPFDNWNGFQRVLSVDERTRAERLRFEQDQLRFVIRRGILRFLVASYVDASPDEIRFHYGPQGKPKLDGGPSTSDFHFNITYSGDRILYAFSIGRRVGIDIEQVRQIPELEHIAERHYSSLELASVYKPHRSRRLQNFFEVWTRKEAVIKALGVGLALPLNSFSVEPVGGLEGYGYQVIGDVENSTRWRVLPLDAGRNFVASICVEETGFSLTTRTLPELWGTHATRAWSRSKRQTP